MKHYRIVKLADIRYENFHDCGCSWKDDESCEICVYDESLAWKATQDKKNNLNYRFYYQELRDNPGFIVGANHKDEQKVINFLFLVEDKNE